MRRYGLILLIVLTGIIPGCQLSDTLTFKGASENWQAKVVVHKASGQESEDVIITYTGDKPENVGMIEYQVEAPSWGSGRSGVELNKEGVFMNEGKSLNERNTPEYVELLMTINWEDGSETLSLKREEE
ncbi:hypothetical protein [Rossellomorea aquimaris]|uniref:hypothetical protein n=1 Tax=Rossellomorea aquimaris TaxID=189382 RepID=UPI0007D0A63D|nr:hypothetical protein [Rossellomorea aquimaris]